MNNYLADTTVLIDHLRGQKKATAFLQEFSPSISVVTIAELIQGSRNKQDQALAVKLCTTLPELTVNKKIADFAIELMKQYFLSRGLQFLDALVAATAMENNLTLVSENLKHFRFIKVLEVISQKTLFRE